MRRIIGLLLLCLLAGCAASRSQGLESALPPGATVVVTERLDLTGDGRPELVVGYTLPTGEVPPTVGHAAVLEQDPAGGYRRFDLPGAWPGHNVPRFQALDLTGDGRPELMEEAGGGAAWGTVRVFRRAAEVYELLLEDDSDAHALWDADGDGVPEIIARKRTRRLPEAAFQRFIWRDGRFAAWHAPEWSHQPVQPLEPREAAAMPAVVGLSLADAEAALNRAGLNLGLIAELDAAGEAGQVVRQEDAGDGRVHVAVAAGDTSFQAPMLPPVEGVYSMPWKAPAATKAEQRAAWRGWLQELVGGVEQVVHTRSLWAPAYYVELHEPWTVTLGGVRQRVRWVGVGVEPPHRGLLYLAVEEIQPGQVSPNFTVALFTTRALEPLPVPLDSWINRSGDPGPGSLPRTGL